MGGCFQSKRRFLKVTGAGAVSLFVPPASLEAEARDPSRGEIVEYLRRRIPVSFPDEGTPEIGSGYLDMRDLRNLERPKPHTGIDIAQARGAEVIAAAPGLAQNSHNDRAGYKVRIIHETGYYLNEIGGTKLGYSIPLVMATVYSHLSKSAIPQNIRGDRWVHVERGEVIGAVGNSGNWAGPKSHLHFGLYTLGPNKSWADNWEHINPHLLWAKGPGQVTRYDPSGDYSPSLRGLKLTFPLAPLPG